MMRVGLVDGVIAIVILGSTIYSLIKGFIKELFLIVAIVVGVLVATKFYPVARDFFLPWLHNLTISTLVGFLLVFFLIAVVFVIIGNIVSKLVYILKMGFLDRILGGVLGVLKGILICGIGCMLILAFIPKGEDLLKDSVLAPRILSLTSRIFSFLPKTVWEKYKQRLRHLNRPRGMVKGQTDTCIQLMNEVLLTNRVLFLK